MRAGEYVFVRIDCRLLGNVDQGPCFYLLRDRVINRLEELDAALGAEMREKCTGTTAHFGLRTLFREVQAKGLRLILVFDDFDDLARNPNLEDNFFAALRSLATMYDIAYLLASRRPLHELEQTRPEASTFSGICQVIRVPAFSITDSRRLVMSYLAGVSVQFHPCITDLILGLGINRPYRVQLAGYHAFEVWRENDGQSQQADCVEIERRFTESTHPSKDQHL
jgi:hypothetical protein